MVFSKNPSQGDGANDRTGFDFQLGSAADSAGSMDAAPQYTSRREARSAAAPQPSRAARRAPVARKAARKSRLVAKSASTTPSRREIIRAKNSRTISPAFARPSDSAYPADRLLVVVRPAKKTAVRKKGSGLLTVLAVVGLFGSVALPAAALAPKVGGDTSVVAAKVGDAALSVSSDVLSASADRGQFTATNATDLRSQRSTKTKDANFSAYLLSGAREAGDDYPWFAEPSNNQGGGLSPLNYFYRECVDFVAWRLNRDAGTTAAPFAFVWSDLTPGGGNGRQWKSAWKSHGWPTSATPIVGSVAYFGAENHVAYVKAVNADGTVLLEEYNWQNDHLYSQRTIASTDVELFLYPPPRA